MKSKSLLVSSLFTVIAATSLTTNADATQIKPQQQEIQQQQETKITFDLKGNIVINGDDFSTAVKANMNLDDEYMLVADTNIYCPKNTNCPCKPPEEDPKT